MSKNVTIAGTNYNDVPGVTLNVQGGGTAFFPDVSATTATDEDVASGKIYYKADGSQSTGTGAGGGAVVIEDTTDVHGGTIREITATNVFTLQNKSNINPTTSSQTITPDAGYEGLSSVQINGVATGTAGTPSASKGAVSNHSVTVTPSVTNTTGYITGGTKTGSAVTVTAAELASGDKSITANGNNIDVVGYSTVSVNVSGGGGKAAQIASGVGRVANTAYTSSNISLTVAKTGTYSVYWNGYRSSTSGTSGSQLYIAGSAYGSANTTFNSTYTNVQNVHLSGVSLTANQTITVYARSRSGSYYMYIMDLVIIEE